MSMDLNKDSKESMGQIKVKNKSSKSIRTAGKKIEKSIKIFQLKKRLDWIKNNILKKEKVSQKYLIGTEEKKLKILLKELEMLKKFNMLGFDSDAINLIIGLYYMVEMINDEDKITNFLAADSIPEKEKVAMLEVMLREWWGRVKLLPSYKERISKKYEHMGTKVVVYKLYSNQKFVNPLNKIINEINKNIKKRNIEGLINTVKKAELFCEEIKKMAGRPKKRKYSDSTVIDVQKMKEKKPLTDLTSPEENYKLEKEDGSF